ncbi:hypothetical protein GCM10010218_23740 [Streptomyces mashuensis]|uniref:Uncharacterized protein n=1 Tax=Streptomyces mashuensis TaxID=33904 RepID=A0A919EBE4_9ACTN|nr:hypothetical protein GCM10010218_23740 [Streptomyces mashuensis]
MCSEASTRRCPETQTATPHAAQTARAAAPTVHHESYSLTGRACRAPLAQDGAVRGRGRTDTDGSWGRAVGTVLRSSKARLASPEAKVTMTGRTADHHLWWML